MQRIRIKYKKEEDLRFIGHLDMVRLWERAIRRADLPAAYSEGFNPRQKLSFGPPLSLGLTSDCELLDITLSSWANPEDMKGRLNSVLPKGIEITETKNIFSGLASLTAVIRFAEYSAVVNSDIRGTIDHIINLDKIIIKRKDKEVDIRPMIKDLRLENGKLMITVQCDNLGTLKGSEISGLFTEGAIGCLKRTGLC